MLLGLGAAKEVWTVNGWLTAMFLLYRPKHQGFRTKGKNKTHSKTTHPTPPPLAVGLLPNGDAWCQQVKEQDSELHKNRTDVPTWTTPKACGTKGQLVPIMKCKSLSAARGGNTDHPPSFLPVADTLKSHQIELVPPRNPQQDPKVSKIPSSSWKTSLRGATLLVDWVAQGQPGGAVDTTTTAKRCWVLESMPVGKPWASEVQSLGLEAFSPM